MLQEIESYNCPYIPEAGRNSWVEGRGKQRLTLGRQVGVCAEVVKDQKQEKSESEFNLATICLYRVKIIRYWENMSNMLTGGLYPRAQSKERRQLFLEDHKGTFWVLPQATYLSSQYEAWTSMAERKIKEMVKGTISYTCSPLWPGHTGLVEYRLPTTWLLNDLYKSKLLSLTPLISLILYFSLSHTFLAILIATELCGHVSISFPAGIIHETLNGWNILWALRPHVAMAGVSSVLWWATT